MSDFNQNYVSTAQGVVDDSTASAACTSIPSLVKMDIPRDEPDRPTTGPPWISVRRREKKRHRRRKYKARAAYKRSENLFDSHGGSEPPGDVVTADISPAIGIAHFRSHIQQFLRSINFSFDSKLLEEIEAAMCLVIGIQNSANYAGVASTVVLYLKRYTNESMILQIMQYIDASLGFESQSSKEANGWVEALKDMQTNWSKIRHGKFIKNLSRLMGILVTVGMCSMSHATFSIGGFKVFEPQLLTVHTESVDFLEAVSNTIIFFVERISTAWEAQSVAVLFEDERETRKLDDDYTKCISWWGLVENGNLEKIAGKTDNEFTALIEHTIERFKIIKESKHGFDKKNIEDKILRLCNIVNDLTTLKVSGSLREAPFALEIFGKSNQGKSSVLEQMITAMLVSADMPTDKQFQRTINASDKFMSNYTTKVLVAIMDDFGNDKEKFAEKAPTRSIIDFCNNAVAYGNSAEISGKGKKFLEPKIVAVTTNVKNLSAGAYSNCPYSIQRRMNAVITVEAKPEFQLIIDGKPGGLDSEKVSAHYAALGVEPVFDDLWNLTVERAVEPSNISNVALYAPVEWTPKGGSKMKLENVGMQVVLNYLIEQFAIHRRNQAAILARSRKSESAITRCGFKSLDGKECPQIRGYCMAHRDYDPEKEPVCLETHIGMEFTRSLETAWDMVSNRISRDVFGLIGGAQMQVAGGALDAARHFASHWNWMHIFPSAMVKSDVFVRFALKYKSNTVQKILKYTRNTIWATALTTIGLTHRYKPDHAQVVASVSMAGAVSYHLFADEILHHVAKKYLVWQNTVSNKPRTNFMRNTSILWSGLGTYLSYTWLSKGTDFASKCIITTMWGFFGFHMQRSFVKNASLCFRTNLVDVSVATDSLLAFREKHIGRICKSFAIVGCLYSLAQVVRQWRSMNPQGSLEPMTEQEIEDRDNEKSPWTSVIPTELPVNNSASTTTPEQLFGLVSKNLVYGSVHREDGAYAVDGLFLRSNVVVIPDHYFDVETLDVTFRKKNPDTSGGKFACRLSRASSYKVPNADLRICYSATGGSFKDLTKYFINDHPSKIDFTMLYRSKDGCLTRAKGLACAEDATTSHSTFPGYVYKSLTINTFYGLCGATVVSNRSAIIYGFHLGGKAGRPFGAAGILRKHQIEEGYTHLRTIEGVILSGSAEHFETQVLSKQVVELGAPITAKNVLRFLPHDSQIEYYGSTNSRSTFKSEVKNTLISDTVAKVMDCTNIYRGPKVLPQWEGWQKCLANMAEPAHPFPHPLLDIAVRDYKSRLIPVFKMDYWSKSRPMTERETINGIPGKRFMDPIKMGTAIGYPLIGKKRNFITEEVDDNHVLIRSFIPEIMEEIDRCEGCYKRGERAYTIAKGCKKDEILAKDKCRIFFGNPISLTFLVRKYFLPILRVLQMNPIASECAVGVNSQGPEWEQLHQRIFKHGGDRLIGGDYGKYDQKLPSQLLFAALRVMIDFARMCEYDQADIDVMEAMTGDIVFATIAFDGNLIGLTEGSHISGNSLTVVLNSICGSLNMRSYFYSNYWPKSFEERIPFGEAVALITYGDDNIGSVRADIDNFTIKGASEFLESYGQTYTMPDKTSALSEFLPLKEFEFLKRKTVYHEELGMHVGALIDASCFKSLHCYMRGKNPPLTEEAACAVNIDGALSEWFLHGREVYERRQAELKIVAEEHDLMYLLQGIDRTFDERVEDWHSKYTNPQGDMLSEDTVEEETFDTQTGKEPERARYNPNKMCQAVSDLLLDRTKSPFASGYHMALTSYSDCWLPKGFCERDTDVFTSGLSPKKDQTPACIESCMREAKERLTEFFKTLLAWLQTFKPCNKSSGSTTTVPCTPYPEEYRPVGRAKKQRFDSQSGQPETETETTGSETAENVQFSEGQTVYHEEIQSYADTTRTLQEPSGVELNNFFSRPIKIYSFQVATNTPFEWPIDPWTLFWTNPRVANRVNNYSLMRCKMHVKVNINGNGFYHGRFIAAYHPYWTKDDFRNPGDAAQIAQLSQLPFIFINPTTATGGELTLPFFWHKNAINITKSNAYFDLGRLIFRSINPLRTVSDATGPLTVTVFAWATDVELSVLTSNDATGLSAQSGLEIQMGSETDKANSGGVVSRASAHVARWAGMLKTIPEIAPFMMATEAVASITGTAASALGFSRPTITRTSDPYREQPHASLATTDTPDLCQKLTLHSNQELSVDPRLAGVSEIDPLAIKSIATRESYLTSFEWSLDDAIDAELFRILVDPTHRAYSLSFDRYLTPMAYAALPFKYWTGTMKIRFQIVCSQYHKGKLRIVYEPNDGNTTEYNTNYMKVIDLADEQDITIKVGVQQDTSLLPVRSIMDTTSTFGQFAFNTPASNGSLYVYVVNGLAAPAAAANTDATVSVNVFVSADDDFEVFVPSNEVSNVRFLSDVDGNYASQMGMEADTNNSITDMPSGSPCYTLGVSGVNHPHLSKVFIGEGCCSLRTLAKRYNLWITIPTHIEDLVFGILSIFPYLRGGVPGAVDTTEQGDPYNYCVTNVAQYIRMPFLGWRGSMRYKFIPRGGVDRNARVAVEAVQFNQHLRAFGILESSTSWKDAQESLGTGLALPGLNPYNGQAGCAIEYNRLNGVLEVEVPYYSNERFDPGRTANYTDSFGPSAFAYRIEDTTVDTTAHMDVFVSIGEDFQTYFWGGTPRLRVGVDPN
jgi:hypothetical protein